MISIKKQLKKQLKNLGIKSRVISKSDKLIIYNETLSDYQISLGILSVATAVKHVYKEIHIKNNFENMTAY